MTIRTRILIGFLTIAVAGFAYLVQWMLRDLRPHYLKSMEESLVDTATLLSSLAASQAKGDSVDIETLHVVLDHALSRKISARIYDISKNRVDVRVYVTDTNGIVVFDSDNGRDEGRDYSRWNDVQRTLEGGYGARATVTETGDTNTTVLHVASPIRIGSRLAGVLTVAKPVGSISAFVQKGRQDMLAAGILVMCGVALIGYLVSIWVTAPITRLTAYARAVKQGRHAQRPAARTGAFWGRSEIDVMGEALEEMRQTLEGKKYIEKYVQTLTHEIKSPVSTIHGAAQLMDEDMEPERRRRFLENIRAETERIRSIVDRLLQLSAVENRKELRDVEAVDMDQLVRIVVGAMKPVTDTKRLTVHVTGGAGCVVQAESFLLRQAVTNLLQNAVEFSSEGSRIDIAVRAEAKRVSIRIDDSGPGIPDYARERIFERFYSLQRPGTNRKSSGLGLNFVREVAHLHHGSVTVENRDTGGTTAILTVPISTPAESL